MKNCNECKKEYDFDNMQFAICRTCDKRFLCPDCYWVHECVPGKSRRLLIIGNPKWLVNLVKKDEALQ